MRRMLILFAGVVLSTSAAAAQTIDPGMTQDQVVERLGRPQGQRTAGAYTYLFFRNGCERTCGTQDLVILENGVVVDAIFRAAGRQYSGTSSSPRGATAVRTPGSGQALQQAHPARAGQPTHEMPPAAAEARGVAPRDSGRPPAAAGDTTPGAAGQLQNIRQAVREQQMLNAPTVFRMQPPGARRDSAASADTTRPQPGMGGGGRENRPYAPGQRPATAADSLRDAALRRQQGGGTPPPTQPPVRTDSVRPARPDSVRPPRPDSVRPPQGNPRPNPPSTIERTR